jgi:hypothetical protein
VAGYSAVRGGFLRATSAVATNSNTGFFSQTGGNLQASPASASYNVTNGFRAEDISSAVVSSSTARSNGVGYYGTEGNTSALIRWS